MRQRQNADIIKMGRRHFLILTSCVLLGASGMPKNAEARGEDSVVQYYCARGFAHVAGPIEKLFLPKTTPTNDFVAWKNLLEKQISNPAASTGVDFAISAKDAPQSVETLKWMIGALNGRTITKPWQVAETQGLKKRLKEFELQIQRTGTINWKEYLELSTDFSETMGRRAPIEDYNTRTTNIVIDRDYIDRDIARSVARQPYAIVVPTHRPMSIAEMNDVSPYPIFPAELVAYRKMADRELYYPLSYFGHDLAHGSISARAFAVQIKRLEAGEITRAQYLQYIQTRAKLRTDFTAMAANESPRTRNALELLWFNITHEPIDHVGFTLAGEMNPASLQQITRLNYGDRPVLVETALYHLKYRDIFDSNVGKPTEDELREAFLILKRFADSLPSTP